MALIGNIAIGMGVNSTGLDAGLNKAAGSITLFGSRIENTMARSMGSADRIKAFGMNAADLAGGLEGQTIPRIRTMGDALKSVGITGESAMGALKFGAAAAAAAIVAAGAAILTHGFNSLKAADDTMDLADRLGTTAGNLKVLHYVAKLSGSEIEAMDQAVGKLSANLGDAAVKSTPAGQALQRIGLDAKKLAAMDPGLAVEEIIKNFDKFPTSAEQAAAAMDIFGKGGLGILGTLRLGSEGLAKLTAETGDMRAALSGVSGKQISEANDAMDRLSFAWEAFGTMVAVQIAPMVTDLVTNMTTWMKEASKEGSTAAETFKSIASAIGLAAKAAKQLWDLNPNVLAWKLYNTISPQEKIVRRPESGAKPQPIEAPKPKPKAMALDSELVSAISKSREWEKTLKDQTLTFGMTADAAELYKLKLAGIPPEQIRNLAGLVMLKDQMEKNKATFDLMKSDAKAFYTDTRTPAELLIEQQTKLNMLLRAGLIDRTTYDRAMKKDLTDKAKQIVDDTRTPLEMYEKKLGELEQMLKGGAIDTNTFNRAVTAEQTKFGSDKPRLATMAEMGSKEAYSAIMKFQSGGEKNDPQKKIAKNSDEAIKVAREQLAELKKAKSGVELYSFGT